MEAPHRGRIATRAGDPPTRIAMVGAGAVARRHAAVLSDFDDVVLQGVTDPAGDAAAALAGAVGATVFPDIERMLDALDPDAVYICVPPFAHGAPERQLIDRGVPFFVEKPLARDLDVAEALAAAVAERGLVTATGYHWRYLDVLEHARELVAATPARLAIGAWLDKEPPSAWWLKRLRSGGQVIEQVTHVIDLMLTMLGDVSEVYAIAAGDAGRRPDADVDAVTAATLRFTNGTIGSLAASWLLPARTRVCLEMVCDGRRIELSDTRLVVDADDGRTTISEGDDREAKRRVDRAFIDAVRGRGGDVRAPYEVALQTHRVACAITRSAAEHAPVATAWA